MTLRPSLFLADRQSFVAHAYWHTATKCQYVPKPAHQASLRVSSVFAMRLGMTALVVERERERETEVERKGTGKREREREHNNEYQND
jgi:hypothetical protein